MFETKDPLGRRVVLKKGTWEYKILNYHQTNDEGQHGNSHPEMERYFEEVKLSIEKPLFIAQDTKTVMDEEGVEQEVINDARQEYLRFFFDKDKLGMIKTIVDFSKGDENGEIVTTHKINKAKIKDVKLKGGVVYDATK